MDVYTGKEDQQVLSYLLKRRSAKVDDLIAPGPDAAELEQILTAAMRVPDHGKMCPWYTLVFEGEARQQIGDVLAEAFIKANPDAREDKIESERGRFMRAPLVIALVSRIRKGKKPIWEQILSAGAAGMNLSLAVHSLGYGVHWLTEWYAFDENVRSALGLDERDNIVGFFYIGTCGAIQADRERPDLTEIVTHWTPDAAINKGDCYDVEKLGFPEVGFSVDVSSID